MKKFFIVILLLLLFSSISFSFFFEHLLQRAIEYSWDEQYDEAEEIFLSLMRTNKTPDLIIAYSNMLGWQEKFDEAIKLIESFEQENDEVKKNLAKIYLWKGEYDKSFEIFKEVKERGAELGEEEMEFYTWYEKNISQYGNLQGALRRSEQLMDENRFGDAENLLSALFEFFDTDKHLILKYAELYERQGQYVIAREFLLAFDYEDNCQFLFKLFEYEYNLNFYDLAYEKYELLVKNNCTAQLSFRDELIRFVNWYEDFMINYEDYDAAVEQAIEYSREDKFDESMEIIDQLFEFYFNMELVVLYGNNLAWAERYDEALTYLESYKYDDDVRALIAKVYLYISRFDEAYEIAADLRDRGHELDEEIMEFIKQYEAYHNISLDIGYSTQVAANPLQSDLYLSLAYNNIKNNLNLLFEYELELINYMEPIRYTIGSYFYINEHYLYLATGNNIFYNAQLNGYYERIFLGYKNVLYRSEADPTLAGMILHGINLGYVLELEDEFRLIPQVFLDYFDDSFNVRYLVRMSYKNFNLRWYFDIYESNAVTIDYELKVNQFRFKRLLKMEFMEEHFLEMFYFGIGLGYDFSF